MKKTLYLLLRTASLTACFQETDDTPGKAPLFSDKKEVQTTTIITRLSIWDTQSPSGFIILPQANRTACIKPHL